MSCCPGYRVRLFLSVDLVGSTAFKDDEHGAGVADDGLSLVWMRYTRAFYRNFPSNLGASYAHRVSAVPEYADAAPRIWKTIGDEIVFCCRVLDQFHLWACVASFIQALGNYGRVLSDSGGHLDVKGHGWLAVFPTPNVAMAISDRGSTDADLPGDEEAETACDAAPERFDFLGRHVDAGFRLSVFTRPDRFLMSVELAYLLTIPKSEGVLGSGLGYHGREVMKGVLGGRPYPIFFVDTDPDETIRDVRSAERTMLGQPEITRHNVRTFLERFVQHEEIELPVITKRKGEVPSQGWPLSYLTYVASWEAIRSELDTRIERERSGEGGEAGRGVALTPELPDTLGAVLGRVKTRLKPSGDPRPE